MQTIQNIHLANTQLTLRSGEIVTGNHAGVFTMSPSDAEFLICTPGWSRIGDEPRLAVNLNPPGDKPSETGTVADVSDPTLHRAEALADHLKSLAGQQPPAIIVPGVPGAVVTETSDKNENGLLIRGGQVVGNDMRTALDEKPEGDKAPADTKTETGEQQPPAKTDVAEAIAAAKARGINVPKAVLAKGDEDVLKYIDAALNSVK